jgi:hypothetical protein
MCHCECNEAIPNLNTGDRRASLETASVFVPDATLPPTSLWASCVSSTSAIPGGRAGDDKQSDIARG